MNSLYKNYLMKMGGQWIKSAIKKPGALTKQAKAAGMSVPEFAQNVLSNKEDYSGTTVKRANLAKTLSRMKKGQDGMEFKNPMGSDQMMEEAEMTTVNPTMPEMDVEVGIEALDPNLDFARKDIASLEKQAEKDNVRSYQRMLNQKYGAGLSEDGAWGPKTQAAYDKFIMSKPKAKPATQEPSPMTKNPERDLPNFERIDQVNIRAPRRVETRIPKLQPPIPQIQRNYMPTAPRPAVNNRSYSDNTRTVGTMNPKRPLPVYSIPKPGPKTMAPKGRQTTIGPTPNGYRSVLYDQFLERNKLK
jgi:hypothetical protein